MTTREPGQRANPAGNERLTAMSGAVLLVLFIAECLTLPNGANLLTLNVFLGMLLLGPVGLTVGAGCGVWRARRAGGTMVGRSCAEDVVQVEVSPEAEEFVRRRGGQLWVWAAHPRVCCWGTPAYMYAATEPPRDPDGFSPAHTGGLEVWYRIPGGRRPDVLEIGLRGKRRPHVEAYWDGCIYAL